MPVARDRALEVARHTPHRLESRPPEATSPRSIAPCPQATREKRPSPRAHQGKEPRTPPESKRPRHHAIESLRRRSERVRHAGKGLRPRYPTKAVCGTRGQWLLPLETGPLGRRPYRARGDLCTPGSHHGDHAKRAGGIHRTRLRRTPPLRVRSVRRVIGLRRSE